MSLPYTDLPLWQAALLPAVSFGVGILGGFVGLALGTMRLPVLLLLGLRRRHSRRHEYRRQHSDRRVPAPCATCGRGRVDRRVVLLVGVPSMVGAFVAGFASEQVPEPVLLGAAGVLVFWQGIEFLAPRPAPGGRHGGRRRW